jgi:WD40 repeat protein
MGHRNAVNCVAVSKDGSIIASGSEDKTAKIWDTSSGKCAQTFSKGHHTGIRSVHFFDEDKYVVAACDDMVLSWNVASTCDTSDTIWTIEQFLKTTLKRAPAWQINVIGWGVTEVLCLDSYSTQRSLNQRCLKTAYTTQSPSYSCLPTEAYLFTGSLPSPVNVPLNRTGTIVTAVAVSSDGNWAATVDSLGSLRNL